MRPSKNMRRFPRWDPRELDPGESRPMDIDTGLHSLFALELTTFRVASSERCWTSGLCRARQARVPLSATVLLAVGQQGVHLAFSDLFFVAAIC